ncbi:pentapeptide repeat-containing protein [Oscillatoriales cyanobacterium LEGE 11467]|uniref:Pentapeptide repeat-containing protein n=1 Tax=Zarconia navalis LEGE 11467 TaxID=1828826 RepID=A0A928VV55_9CYAN|nr:pentapeptide repeat-containing protein [Zarconia navalis]MBE9039287.1 pentapeptide repeat-containing protein [Zarconia navalis LEGE 11467]
MADPKHLRLLKQSVDTWNEWRANNYGTIPDLVGADLQGINLAGADLSRGNFHQANLGYANLFGVDLGGANLSRANLSAANLSGAFINKANIRKANLCGAQLWVAQLFQTDLAGAILNEADLSDAELGRANLSHARLTRTKLCGANLGDARLTHAELLEVRANGTNFQGAILTGMYLVSWDIDRTTQLSDAICEYIYLREYQDKLTCKIHVDERCPGVGDRNFEPGEFAKLFQSSPETLDFAFTGGIEWRAFLGAFERLCRSMPENDFTIGAMETRQGGTIVVRVRICDPCNREQVEKFFKQAYQDELQALDKRDDRSLSAKERQSIVTHRTQSADLLEIVRSLARNRPPLEEFDRVESDGVTRSETRSPWDATLEIPSELGESKLFSQRRWLI